MFPGKTHNAFVIGTPFTFPFLFLSLYHLHPTQQPGELWFLQLYRDFAHAVLTVMPFLVPVVLISKPLVVLVGLFGSTMPGLHVYSVKVEMRPGPTGLPLSHSLGAHLWE